MSDSLWLRRMAAFGLLGVVAMTVLVPGILLARGTTGHDWHAVGKLALAEAMLFVGFSEYTRVPYRTPYSGIWNVPRFALVEMPSVLRARQRILTTIGDGVLLGGCVGGTVFGLTLLGAVGRGRRGRTVATVEPAARRFRDPERTGRVPGLWQPGFGSARIGLLVVSPAEIERLLALLGRSGRPGHVDLPGPESVEAIEAVNGLQAQSVEPALPSAGKVGPAPETAVPADPDPADADSDIGDENAGTSAGGKSGGRGPGKDFY